MTSSYGSTAPSKPSPETVEESHPILSKHSNHPLPGQGGWHESEWRGAQSIRTLRRPLWDPALYAVDDYADEFVQAKFAYITSTGLAIPKHFLSEKLGKIPVGEVLIGLLLSVSILMDGVRPIVLVWAKGDSPTYPFMFSVWVVLVKILVVVFSVIMYLMAVRRGDVNSDLSLKKRLWLSGYFVVPVVCYVASDLLNFVLFEHHISPTLFACVKQSRIVLTALLFRFVLRRNVSEIQWIAIVQLCLASLLFVNEDLKPASETPTEWLGIYYLLFKCLLDSVAVVWMDKYFKALDDCGFPYVEQQVAFSVLSLVGGAGFVLFNNSSELLSGRPLLDGFNEAAWLSVLLTGMYGVLVSLLLKYLDSMVKQFQALASIVVTTLADQYFFGKTINLSSWVAIFVILISVFLYKVGAAPGKAH